MDRRIVHADERVPTDYVCLIAANSNGTYRVVFRKTGTREPLAQDTIFGRDEARLSGARYFTDLIGMTQPEPTKADRRTR